MFVPVTSMRSTSPGWLSCAYAIPQEHVETAAHAAISAAEFVRCDRFAPMLVLSVTTLSRSLQ